MSAARRFCASAANANVKLRRGLARKLRCWVTAVAFACITSVDHDNDSCTPFDQSGELVLVLEDVDAHFVADGWTARTARVDVRHRRAAVAGNRIDKAAVSISGIAKTQCLDR